MADEAAAPPPPPPGFVPVEVKPPVYSSASANAPPPPPPGFVPLEAPGVLESLGRGAAEGATFGYDDKLGLDKERREASRKANPWTHFMGELIGGALPMAAAALLPTGATQAAAAGRAAQLASKGASLARTALIPGEINTWGQAAGQGLKLGTVYGGLSGSGHADVKPEDSLGDALKKRAVGAATGAAEGAVVGPLLGAAGHGVYRGGQFIGGLKAISEGETAGLGQGALKTAVRKLEEDRITPQSLIDQIKAEFPDDTQTAGIATRFWGGLNNKQPITSEQVEETVRRALAGEDAGAISAALQAANGGVGPGKTAVQSLLDELAERHLGPLNLVDRTSLLRPGSGTNTQMAMRASAATPSEAAAKGREEFLERQLGTQGRLQQLFERTLGTADFDAAAAQHSGALERAGVRGYAEGFANEAPFVDELTPVLKKWQSQYDGKRGPVPEGVVRALDSFTSKKPVAQGLTAEGRTQASELPLSDRENMLAMWRYAHQPITEPQSISKWAVGYGGLKDPAGDLNSIVGGMAPRGLIRNNGGKNLDDAAQRAWEEGFFPGFDRRPTINEFLEAIERDIRGDKVVRLEHTDKLSAIADQQKMLQDLADVGINARSEVEAMKQLGFGQAGRPLTLDAPPATLREFIDARQNIKQLMDEAKVNSPLKGKLTELYNEITKVVADKNPKWSEANSLWRDGKAAQEAMEAGARMSTRLGASSRENLAEFTSAQKDAVDAGKALAKARKAGDVPAAESAQARIDAANARMELFKVGLVRALNDMLLNQGETHNLTKQLRLPGAKQMLKQVLGKEADQFYKVVDAEAAMHRTYQSQFGSQTTPLREAIEDLNWAPRFEASMMNPLSWGAPALRLAQEYAARTINAKRNTDLMKLYTETDPTKQLEALRAMGMLHTRRATAGDTVGRPVVGSAGVLPSSLIGLQTGEATQPQPVLKPFRP